MKVEGTNTPSYLLEHHKRMIAKNIARYLGIAFTLKKTTCIRGGHMQNLADDGSTFGQHIIMSELIVQANSIKNLVYLLVKGTLGFVMHGYEFVASM